MAQMLTQSHAELEEQLASVQQKAAEDTLAADEALGTVRMNADLQRKEAVAQLEAEHRRLLDEARAEKGEPGESDGRQSPAHSFV